MQVGSEWVFRWTGLWAPQARILDVACGQGRHLHALYKRGFRHLTGVDRDAQALAGVAERVRTVVADIENGPWPLPGEVFDAVIVTNYLWRPLVPTLLDSVAPGGWLVVETFAHGQASVGRPARPEFLLQPGELLTWVAAPPWRVVAFEDGFEGDGQVGRYVQRLAAVREAVPASTVIAPPRYVLDVTPAFRV